MPAYQPPRPPRSGGFFMSPHTQKDDDMTATMLEPPVVVVPLPPATPATPAKPSATKGVIDTFFDAARRTANRIRVLMARLWAWIKHKAQVGWSRLQHAAGWISSRISKAWGWTRGRIATTWAWIKAKVTKMATWVKTNVAKAAEWVGEKTKTVWVKVKQQVKGFWGWLKSKIKTVWTWVKQTVTKVWEWTSTRVAKAWNWLVAKTPAITAKVMRGVGWIGGKLAQLSTAVKVGLTVATGAVAAVVTHPVFVVIAALAITSLVISATTKGKGKSKSKPKTSSTRPEKPPTDLPVGAQLLAMERQQHDYARELDDFRAEDESFERVSEVMGRGELIEFRMTHGFSADISSLTADFKAQWVEQEGYEEDPTVKMIADRVKWDFFELGVRAEDVVWRAATEPIVVV